MLMKWKSLFAAALSAALAVPAALAQAATGGGIPSGRVISVNFADKGSAEGFAEGETGALPDTEETFGLVPVPGSAWVDCHGATTSSETGISGSREITSAYGSEESISATLTYSAKNMYGLATNSGILKTWLGDGNGAQIEVTNIPFDNYAVIVYFATNNGASFKPVTVNRTKYIGTAAGSEEVTDTGNATWGSPQSSDIALGTNALRVNGLSGDLTIVGASSDGSGARGCIAGFQIVEALPSISVNFAGDESGTYSVPIPKTSEAYGLFPVPGSEWENGFTGSGTIQVSSAYGSSETFSSTLSYKSKNIWHNTDSYDTLLQTYLDDGTKPDENITGASISMEKVPFTEYAVIVYCAAGNGQPFLPVTVNNKTYTWSDTDSATVAGDSNFGDSSVTTPTLGKNALCVTGLTGALTVQGRSGGQYTARGGIAAIQIVCTGEIKTSSEPVAETSVISLNFGSNYGSVPQTATEYGLVPVPGYTWTNISGARGSQTVTVASGKPLTKEPTVAYDSNLTYYYNQATDPFLKGYLDDGDGEGDKQGDGVGASVTVSNLPFWAYDVVVYAGLDTSATVALPVRINDTLYTWDRARGATIATNNKTAVYGEGAQATAEYGKNALRVKGLLRNDCGLTVQGLPRINQNSQRGGIAAIQIVERKVIDQSNFGDLDPDSDTPVHILLTAQISGDLKLPPDAILDLSSYWLFGATPPITGTLTVNEGTQIRLPKGASWTIAGAISGTLAKNAVIVAGSLATGVDVSGGTISADATYVWTGDGNTDLWSNRYNWSSHTVPDAEADVTIPLDANGAVTIELPSDTGAVAKSVTITGPESGSATLALTSAEGETGSLTVSGRMLATGNVTVTQSADITVSGEAKVEVINEEYNVSGSTQAGFHVHQGTWQIRSGTLSMPTEGGTNIGEAGISGGGALIVGGEGASEATLAVRQIRTVYYNKDTRLANGTLRVATDGTLKASSSVQLPQQNYTTELAGGTIETPTLATFAGVTVSDASFLRAPENRALAVTASGSNDALTGAGDVTLSGDVTIESALTGYTGTLTVSAGSALTLSDDARPSLVLEDNASLTVTPTDGEAGSGTIVFPTSMTEEPTGVKYTVSGVDEEETLSVSVDGGKLTLSWGADYPTLSTTSNWSTTESWANLPDGTTSTYPSEGSAILDGTNSPITVKLDTDLSKMTSIFVKGNVTLVTTEAQPAIPACVKLTEEGTILTIDANFSGAWELPAGTTLQVTEDFTSFANLTLEGAVVILDGVSGTEIEAPSPVEFNGGLTIAASNLTLESVYNVGKTLELAGDNITIAGNRFFTDTGTQVVNTGTDNAITGMTGLNGSLAVEGGSLALTLGAKPNKTYFSGATIAGNATLTLAAEPDSSTGVTTARGWFFSATGDGTLEIEVGDSDFRPNFSTLPKKMVFTATAEEQADGVIECKAESGLTLPADFTVTVHPAGDGGAWAPKAVLEEGGNSYLRIYNQLPTNLPAGVDEAVAEAIQQAAQNAGIENKGYIVRLTTGGQSVDVTAATLNDVLWCFTGLKATASADKATLTYAYDFGIVGIKRNTTGDGWVVTAKVQGENAAQAGFAKGNYYVLSVTAGGSEKKVQLTGESGVNETSAATGTVELTVPDTALEGVGDGFTLGVSVSRTAPAQ